jgi:membrane-associated phospholipid phosphatase
MLGAAAFATITIAPLDASVQHAMLAEDVHDNRNLRATANGLAFLGGPGPFVGGAALYLAGRSAGSNRVASLGVSVTEAVVIAAALNGVVKGIAGRTLPNVKTAEPGDFSFGRGFHDGNGSFVSFPSGHTAASFAAAAVIANSMEEWNASAARVIGPAAYSTATLVAVSRLYQNVHWASDLPLGAAIGIWSGRTVVGWQRHHPDNWLTKRMLGLVVVPSAHRLTIEAELPLAR